MDQMRPTKKGKNLHKISNAPYFFLNLVKIFLKLPKTLKKFAPSAQNRKMRPKNLSKFDKFLVKMRPCGDGISKVAKYAIEMHNLLISYINISGNLLLEFNPKKQDFIRLGILKWLKFNTFNSDHNIKYKSLTALSNAAYNSDTATRIFITETLSWDHINRLAKDTNKIVIVEVLSLIRNLVCVDNYHNIGNTNKNSHFESLLKKYNYTTSTSSISSASATDLNTASASTKNATHPLSSNSSSKNSSLDGRLSTKTKFLIDKPTDQLILNYFSNVLKLLQVIIEQISIFEQQLHSQYQDNLGQNTTRTINLGLSTTMNTTNNISMTSLFKNNINLSTRQNISTLKVQTVKILAAIVTYRKASDYIVDEKNNMGNLLQFLLNGSFMVTGSGHAGPNSETNAHIAGHSIHDYNFYCNSLNNPIFGPSILTLCEIYDQTKYSPIKNRLENCLSEIINFGQKERENQKYGENVKDVEKMEKKVLKIEDEEDSKVLKGRKLRELEEQEMGIPKDIPIANNNNNNNNLSCTLKINNQTNPSTYETTILNHQNSNSSSNSSLSSSSAILDPVKQWNAISKLVKKDGLSVTSNFSSFFKNDDYLFVDRAKRISKNNLVERIRNVTRE